MSQIHIIAGPPRSGTTLCAGILHLCGVPMFPSLDKAIYRNEGDEWNPGGHFADAEFHRFAARYLPGLALPSDGWMPDASALSEIGAMIDERSVSAKWGVKGMHAWVAARVLSALGHDVRLIRAMRDVARSQASMESFHRVGESIYAGRTSAFVGSVRTAVDAFYDQFTGPKVTVEFDALFDATATAVGSLAKFAGVVPTPAALAFVNPEWRRF
jgi:hypothetical protein